MHPRNKYAGNPPDIAALASQYPELQPYVVGERGFSWRDPRAVHALTRVLLQHDFGIDMIMPSEKLCPTVTLRLNYIHFIEDLLAATPSNILQAYRVIGGNGGGGSGDGGGGGGGGGDDVLRGVDVGTGASCIYPLLGVRLSSNGSSSSDVAVGAGAAAGAAAAAAAAAERCQWSFLATEIDAASVACARANVARNGWSHLIEVRHVPAGTYLRFLAASPGGDGGNGGASGGGGGGASPDYHEVAAFTMCNPPFFSCGASVLSTAPSSSGGGGGGDNGSGGGGGGGGGDNGSGGGGGGGSGRVGQEAREKRKNPATCLTGTVSEMETCGGELAFVRDLMRDSLALRTRVLWYTSMLGKRASVAPITRELRHAGATAVVVTSFTQGRTARWAVAWTFHANVGEGSVRAAVEAGGSAVLRLDGKRRKKGGRAGGNETAEKTFEVGAGLDESWKRLLEACRDMTPSISRACWRVVVEGNGGKYTATLAGGDGRDTVVRLAVAPGAAAHHPRSHDFDRFVAKIRGDVQRTNRRWRRKRQRPDDDAQIKQEE